jgi:zinc protease
MKSNSHHATESAKAMPPIRRIPLPNGITLLTAENYTLPIVSMYILVQYGSRFESDADAGMASLLGDMLDEGTERRSAHEIAVAVEETGSRLSAFAGYARSGVQIVALADDFPRLLDLAAEMLVTSVFPAERFTQRQNQRLAQIRSREDDPRTVAADAFDEIIYAGHPAHRPTIGYEHAVAGLTRDRLVEAYRRYFIPNNTIISAAGAISSDEIAERVTEAFAAWKPNPDFRLPEIPDIQRQSAPCERIIAKDKEQIHIYLGHLGVKRSNPDFYPLLVMDVILGNSPGMTSRIPRILRDEQGLAYATYASITSTAGVDPGRFAAYIGTSPSNREKALAGLRGEIERITQEPVLDEELEMAKAYLTGSFVFNFETNAQMASFLVEAETHKLGFDFLERYPDLIRAVTRDDVLRVSQTHLDPKNMTTVIVGPIKS